MYRLSVFCILLITACSPDNEAEEIIDRAIERHGVELLDQAEVRFTFRDSDYRMLRDEGLFRYERSYNDTTDILTNEGPTREIDGEEVALSDQEAYSLETTVNSVVYFAFLPYRLRDPAVRTQLLGNEVIRDESYEVVEVTFDEEGGGRDHDDRFIYWVHQQDHTLDYLAYYFYTDGGGSRFREAINRRTISGVTVQDYNNYALEPDTLSIGNIEQYAAYFQDDAVELVSTIELENVTIAPLQ